MLNFHSILLYLLCLNEAASVSTINHGKITILKIFLKQFQFHTSFTDFYLESVKILHSETPFVHGNASLKRNGHEHPKLFIEIELSDALRNYDVIMDRRFICWFNCNKYCEQTDRRQNILQSVGQPAFHVNAI